MYFCSTLHSGAPTGNFESATSDVDRRPPPFGVSQGPSQSSNSQDLIDIHPLEKDGGDPREGAESPVLESVEEHGQPTQGDVQRGSGNGTHTQHAGMHVQTSACTRYWSI